MDFRSYPPGTLVKRSPHCIKEHGSAVQLGILTGHNFYNAGPDDQDGVVEGVICYPSIHWEGTAAPSITHPMNAVPAR